MKWQATSPYSWKREDGAFDVARYIVGGETVFLLWRGMVIVGRFDSKAAAVAATKGKQ